ncbi:MAG: winged helix-turn-helix domain-containing protein [Nanoarchaeota archaeon]|nr:winged helix-turn-helix domain-containing protein [Nanoarchaeota archaeon]MBU4300625.1 winged helix-turn-helix domain-containing protein [Nanoarchaeota archaeon]MBU4452178.1 winged helix-turn-helix domain-containing protein [Nanoarchaeota archaeon]MCG2724218.1 winged helix-turn-helix domain-containing protein [archaeon]
MKKKRARIEIISDILLFIKKAGNAKPTNILYKANLSVPLLKSYLNTLIKDGLIGCTSNGKKTIYNITKKGNKFIEILKEVNSMTQIIEIYGSRRKIL